jgi:hypothetical protein
MPPIDSMPTCSSCSPAQYDQRLGGKATASREAFSNIVDTRARSRQPNSGFVSVHCCLPERCLSTFNLRVDIDLAYVEKQLDYRLVSKKLRDKRMKFPRWLEVESSATIYH